MSANDVSRLPFGQVRRSKSSYGLRCVQPLLLPKEKSEGRERSGTYGWVPVQPGGHA